ncbi:MAG: ABC transporter permease [Verrucomicrobiae bacterium]|nr:ABC transporter permease [Verrucomicrobiae bacterium]
MSAVWILFRKEMMSYFYSPIAYIIGVCVLFLNGVNVTQIVKWLSQQPSDYSVFQVMFAGFFTWIVFLIVPPVLTMRLFADEKRMGTIESLMTTPLRDWEYVMAKFLSALCLYMMLWLPTVNIVFVLRHFAHDTAALELGPLFGGYLGVLMTGMLFLSVGCMASACTRNQVVAAVITFAINTAIFFVGLLFFMDAAGKLREVFEYVSLYGHMDELCRGVLDWRRPFFYLTSAAFFLVMTQRIVQSRQWKS